MRNKQDIITSVQAIFWDIKKGKDISDEAIVERVIQLGDWKDIHTLIEYYGKEKLAQIYKEIRIKKRQNLSKKTLHFFDIYFHA